MLCDKKNPKISPGRYHALIMHGCMEILALILHGNINKLYQLGDLFSYSSKKSCLCLRSINNINNDEAGLYYS